MEEIEYIIWTIVLIEAIFLADIYLSIQEKVKPMLSFSNLITINVIVIFGIIIATLL